MPIAGFTGFGRMAPALRGRFALQSFLKRPARRTVMLSEADSKMKEFHSGQSRARTANYPRFATCHHGQADAFSRSRKRIVVAGRFSGFANERRRSSARSNSFDTRRQG